ncbi:transketolase [Candidatus Poribacteria bacterium]|nr:transketolase [Candidatus Poribacteria bacterium]
MKHLEKIADQVRGEVIQLSHSAQTPHLGSSLSCIDILVVLYWSILSIDSQNSTAPDRDRFILSKGHAATALYAALAYRGFFPLDELRNYAQPGSVMAEHPSIGSAPGIEAATGSLGHGLPIGLGMALASQIQNLSYRVFVVMSDGECNEGSVWEAAMIAPAHGLSNLIVVIDYNKWQATGRSQDVTSIDPLDGKWRAFGWDVYELDGNSIENLVNVLGSIPNSANKPIAIIAHTIKGKGVSFMEDDNNWHYRIPTASEVEEAKKELGLI